MKKTFLLFIALLCVAGSVRATVVYVDSTNIAGFQDGTSWATAFSSFQGGINAANAGDSVWVAKATYMPGVNSYFTLKEGVKIFGGFLNTATSFTQRNPVTNITRLISNGSFIIRVYDVLTNASLLDGFTVSNNSENYGGISLVGLNVTSTASPTINNCVFTNNNKGAISMNKCNSVISNCVFSGNRWDITGFITNGGVAIKIESSSPLITNCTFANDTVGGGYGVGGAITIRGGDNDIPNINNCTFSSNIAASGGAIYIFSAKPTIQNCTFVNNNALSGYGGAINNRSNLATIANCTFTNNESGRGGAISNSFDFNAARIAVIKNCTFTGNRATYYGGGIHNRGNGPMLIKDNMFNSNVATLGGGIFTDAYGNYPNNLDTFIGNVFHADTAVSGGAFYNDYTSPYIANCSFTNNIATQNGAGILDTSGSSPIIVNCLFNQNNAALCGGSIYNNSASNNSKIVNCTITGNTASMGGGIYNANNSNPKLSNTIVYNNNNGIVNDGTSSPSVFYSLIQGYPASATNHNIAGTTNPLFVNASGSNYQLQSTSPCINQGRNDSIPTGITTDLAGNARIANTTVDLGAYEYIAPPPSVALGNDTAICAGSSLTLNAGNPGSTYTWSTGAITQTINVTTSGTYSVTVTNSVGSATDAILVTVNANVAPTVSIAASQSNVCAGTNVTFTATATNGGATPSYQWKKNGANVGTNAATYTYTPANGDVITCVLTSSVTCASPSSITSSGITMVVNPTVAPTITITASQNNICTGTSVTFTASATNGGATPSYQWKKNGTNVGTNSTTYSYTPTNGDIITCVLTSNAVCASTGSATSSGITMVVNPIVTPSVSIVASQNNICAGTSVTFTATPTNGGVTPSYQWKKNGTNVGTNSATYTNSTLANGDVITCVLTSNVMCVTTPTATSNSVTMIVNPTVAPTVSIEVSQNNICAGTSVTFTATPTNGGTTPSYQWKINSTNVGANAATYTSSTLANGDIVTCVLTSNATCASPASITSSSIPMVVNPSITPSVNISADNITVCEGTSVTLTATPINGGTTPSYQWKKNGSNVGTNSTIYSYNPADGDIINCVLTSNAECASVNSATSNNVTLEVNASVTPTISVNATPGTSVPNGTNVTFAATTTNGGSSPQYQWRKNGATISSATTATWQAIAGTDFADGDDISARLISNANCTASDTTTSNTLTMHINTTGINEINNNDITLYPNPNSGKFVLEGTIQSGKYNLIITNLLGQKVFEEEIIVIGKKMQSIIEIGNLPASTYNVSLMKDSETIIITKISKLD